MAKQIEMMSAAAQAAAVQKLMDKRAERLRTKQFPRPEKFAAEMKQSLWHYEGRVYMEACMKYAKQILKAAKLATDETTEDFQAVWAGKAERQGVFIQVSGRPDNNQLVQIAVHGSTDEKLYREAFEAYDMTVTEGTRNFKPAQDSSFSRVILYVSM